MTFDSILKRLLSYIPNSRDKREGSVAHDHLAPAAREFERAQADRDKKHANTFAGTAEREWLIECCKQIGIAPFDATFAYRKGQFKPASLEIPIGSRFNFEDLNFIVTEKIEDGFYKLRCEEVGEKGNYGEGALLPIQFINGLERADLLAEVLIYGEDDEETEVLRKRYFDTLPTMTIDGNKAQYRKWCRGFAGIGNHKIFAAEEWNGVNTVKVSILSSENTKASQELIDNFQDYLDPPKEPINDDKTAENYPQGRALGNGQAPAGAIVTVTTATVVPVNVEATVIYRSGYTAPIDLKQKITEYLLGLNYVKNVVSFVAISALFQNDEAIDLVVDLTVNGGKNNLTIGEEEIVELGEFKVTEV